MERQDFARTLCHMGVNIVRFQIQPGSGPGEFALPPAVVGVFVFRATAARNSGPFARSKPEGIHSAAPGFLAVSVGWRCALHQAASIRAISIVAGCAFRSAYSQMVSLRCAGSGA